MKKQHGLYVNNLVDDIKPNLETSAGKFIVKRKTCKVSHLYRGEMVAIWQSRNWDRQINLTVSLRMCSTKVNTPKRPSPIARLVHIGHSSFG